MTEQKFRLHREDRRILAALSRNARITNRDLAREIGVPEHVTADRLRLLQSSGMLGTTVLTDYQSFGLHPFLGVRVAVAPGRFAQAEQYLANIEHVSTLYSMGPYAPYQFGLNLVARDLAHAQALVTNEVACCPGVRSWEVHLLGELSGYNPPIVVKDAIRGSCPPVEPYGEIDELDVSIIGAFRNEGRKPYLTVAEELGVVEGTVRRRVVQLLNKGIIRFSPVVATPFLPKGEPSVIWIDVDSEMLEQAAAVLRSIPQLMGIERIFGPPGSFVTVSGLAETEVEQLLDELAAKLPGLRNISAEYVKKVVMLSDAWRDLSSVRPLPLELLSAEGDVGLDAEAG